jgi:hypothetical protein
MSGPFKKDWVHWMLGGSGSVPAALLLSPSRSLSLSLSLSLFHSINPPRAAGISAGRDRRIDDLVRVLIDKRIRFRANERDAIETQIAIGAVPSAFYIACSFCREANTPHVFSRSFVTSSRIALAPSAIPSADRWKATIRDNF